MPHITVQLEKGDFLPAAIYSLLTLFPPKIRNEPTIAPIRRKSKGRIKTIYQILNPGIQIPQQLFVWIYCLQSNFDNDGFPGPRTGGRFLLNNSLARTNHNCSS